MKVRPEPSRKPEGEKAQVYACFVCNSPVFLYPGGRVVPHYDGNGRRCGANGQIWQERKPEGDAGLPEAYCSNGACNFKAGHAGLCSWQKADARAEAERELLEMCNAAAIALRCDGIDALADELLAAVAKYREAK